MLLAVTEQQWMNAAIPLIVTIGMLYYAVRLLVMKDMNALQNGRDGRKRKLKDPEKYRVTAGRLLLMLAGFSAVMAVVSLFSAAAGLGIICVGVIIFMVLWRRMDGKYGE